MPGILLVDTCKLYFDSWCAITVAEYHLLSPWMAPKSEKLSQMSSFRPLQHHNEDAPHESDTHAPEAEPRNEPAAASSWIECACVGG